MGGGSKTTTTVNTSPEERAYQRANTDLAIQQLALTKEEHEWQSQIYQLTFPLLQKYSLLTDQQMAEFNAPGAADNRLKAQQLETAQLDSQLRNIPVQDELLQRQLDEIRRGGAATDEQKRLIAEVTQRALESGTSDVRNALDYGLRDIRDTLAPARGMRPDDAPIQDAGQRLAAEALRQEGQLTSQLRGAQANAELNFPLNASQITSGQTQFQQNLNAGMNQFLQQLKQQALSNRNAFAAQLFQSPISAGEQRLSLINASRPTPVSFARSETTKQSGGSFLSGLGGFISGIGSVASAFSSRELKTDVRPIEHGGPERTLGLGMTPANKDYSHPGPVIDPVEGLRGIGGKDYSRPGPIIDTVSGLQGSGGKQYQNPGPIARSNEDMLQRVARMPVSEWRYKPGTGLDQERHVGPMAEDFNAGVMGKQPGPMINMVDAFGSLAASVKALERRTRQPARWQQYRRAA